MWLHSFLHFQLPENSHFTDNYISDKTTRNSLPKWFFQSCLFLLYFFFFRLTQSLWVKGMLICSLANLEPIAEFLYYVNYGLSFITSKVRQIISVIKNKNWCFQKNDTSKIVYFGILIHVSSWRQQKHQCLCFHYWYYLTNFWRNKWQSIIDVVETLCYCWIQMDVLQL